LLPFARFTKQRKRISAVQRPDRDGVNCRYSQTLRKSACLADSE
jgi:hypothetical protein